jgi:putative exosortase-associated protein (TIGR04073 family)
MTDHNPRNCFRVACLAVASLLIALPAAADAGEDDAAQPENGYSAKRKLGRGVASVVYGMLEVPGNMVQEGRVNGPLYGATVGLFLGAGKMVARIPVGVYEVVTAPFQVPQGYEPILEPEFPWQYFRAEEGELYGLRNSYLAKEQHEIGEIPGAVVARESGALEVRFPTDLLFAFGSAELTPSARQSLDALARVLVKNPDSRLFVKGFTDAIGPESYNLALSEQRARAVRSYLVSRGIDPNQIDTEGFGAALPVASNDSRPGRQANRRVEIEVRAGTVAAP